LPWTLRVPVGLRSLDEVDATARLFGERPSGITREPASGRGSARNRVRTWGGSHHGKGFANTPPHQTFCRRPLELPPLIVKPSASLCFCYRAPLPPPVLLCPLSPLSRFSFLSPLLFFSSTSSTPTSLFLSRRALFLSFLLPAGPSAFYCSSPALFSALFLCCSFFLSPVRDRLLIQQIAWTIIVEGPPGRRS